MLVQVCGLLSLYRTKKSQCRYLNNNTANCGFTGYATAPSVRVCLRLSIHLTNRPIKLHPPTQPYETSAATMHEMDAELLSSAGSASIQKSCFWRKKKSGDVQGKKGEKTLEKHSGTQATHSSTRGAALLDKSASGSKRSRQACIKKQKTKKTFYTKNTKRCKCNQTHTHPHTGFHVTQKHKHTNVFRCFMTHREKNTHHLHILISSA